MAHNHQTQCSVCGSWLYIHEDPLVGAAIGCKFHETVECPKCGNVVYESFTSGHFTVKIIDKPEQI